MWSLGCILGELLGGQPMFPGESTMNQLERIIELTGMPSDDDCAAIKSKHTQTMIESLNIKQHRTFEQLYPNCSPEAIDLLKKLLQFNPDKRLTADETLKHPYLAQFHSPCEEPRLSAPIQISIDDNKRLSIGEYRRYLYKKIIERKRQLRKKRAMKKDSSQTNEISHSSSSESSLSNLHDNDNHYPANNDNAKVIEVKDKSHLSSSKNNSTTTINPSQVPSKYSTSGKETGQRSSISSKAGTLPSSGDHRKTSSINGTSSLSGKSFQNELKQAVK